MSRKFPNFSYAVRTANAYWDGGLRVVFLDLCPITFILDQKMRRLFSDVHNCSRLICYSVVELRGLERFIFRTRLSEVCRFFDRRKGTLGGSEFPIL